MDTYVKLPRFINMKSAATGGYHNLFWNVVLFVSSDRFFFELQLFRISLFI